VEEPKLVQYMPMVYGLRKKILQSAEVVSLEVNVVYRAEVEKGTFLYEVGLEPPLRHRPSLDLTEEETTDDQIVAAYSIATMKDGTKSYEIMRRFEIDKVRQVSQTGATGKTDRQGKPIEPKGPWVDWFAEMAKKTVMRRHAKTLPMSGDVLIDVEGRELTSTGEIVDEGGHGDGADTSAEHVDETPKSEPEKPAKVQRGKKSEKPKEAEQPAAESATAEEPHAEAATDELGIAAHPAAAKAEEILEKFSKAETIIDLERLYRENEQDISSMPDEYYDPVMGGYNRNRVRLGGQRVPITETEPAE
jgi:recombination protein RecT